MLRIPIEDRLEIIDVTHRAALYADVMDARQNADNFTDDCILDETCIGVPVTNGKENFRVLLDGFVAQTVRYMVHYVSNHIISEYDGKTASGLCYVFFIGVDHSGKRMEINGYYDDEYVKEDGRWLISKRVLKHLAPPVATPLVPDVVVELDKKHLLKMRTNW